MASDLSSGCTETIDILDEKEEGEISLEDVSSSEEGGIGHLTCGYVVRTRRTCTVCKSTWGECASWCSAFSKMHYPKGQSRRDPVKGKENRHHVNEAGCATMKHATLSTLQEKNDDLVPISSDSDMEIVGLADMSKQLATRSKIRMKKKKKRKKEYEYLTVDDLISPASANLPITECFNAAALKSGLRETTKETTIASRAHYREPSPTRRGNRTRMIARSPLRRHRSPVSSHPSFHGASRSPLGRSRSPRRSPRRLRSPKRSSSLHSDPSVRASSRRQPTRLNAPPTSSAARVGDRHGDVTRLLKKVKHLDSMGALTPESKVRRGKERHPASLKEKLCNMMRGGNGTVAHGLKGKPSAVQAAAAAAGDDLDDEEDDLALLRQKALETKQRNKPSRPEHPAAGTESQGKANTATAAAKVNDDQDEEDLQLRMIALRSAVMKKHRNRVQRGVRTRSKKKVASSRSESPFTQSFLENIPVPNDELLKFASPPCTPPALPPIDSNHIEDMELDTDVEREKERLPYSPTDKITTDIPIDTELLGIEPSDVSFINLDNSPIFATTNDDEPRPPPAADGSTMTLDNPYFPYYTPSPNHFASSPLPSNSDESFRVDPSVDGPKELLPGYLGLLHGDCIECDLIDGTCCQQTFDGAGNECDYTAAPAYPEPDAASRVRALPVTDLPASSAHPDHPGASPRTRNVAEQPAAGDASASAALAYNAEQPADARRADECAYDVAAAAAGYPLAANNASPAPASGTTSPSGDGAPTIALGDPHEPEDGSRQALASAADVGRNPSDADYIPGDHDHAVYRQTDASREPSYMQGVPDITKDVNKIPTLINKTLVPVPILRSNKQLQQPRPAAKQEPPSHAEPAFKSAEMRPVLVVTDVSSNARTAFKPIKLTSFPRKRHRVLTTPVVFNESACDGPESDASENDASRSNDPEPVGQAGGAPVARTDGAAAGKKRKRTKKSRACLNVVEPSAAEGSGGSCASNRVNRDASATARAPPSAPARPVVGPESKRKKRHNGEKRARENPAKSGKSTSSRNVARLTESPPAPTDPPYDEDAGTEDTGAARRDNRRASSDDGEERPKERAAQSAADERREKSAESRRPSANSDAAAAENGATEAPKNSSRRESMDEDENELRAILLASLTKRANQAVGTTRPLDASANDASPVAPVATNGSATSEPAPPAPKVIANAASVAAQAQATANEPPLGGAKKRPNAAIAGAKGPPKKVVRKAPVPASTRAVNNAKKYQNAIVQRKLNPPPKLEANAVNSKPKQPGHQDNVWSANGLTKKKPSMAYASEAQRIVINLGSDTDSEPDPEPERGNNVNGAFVAPPATVNVNAQEPNTDFEKSLHKFLRDVRKEHETATGAPSSAKPVLSPQAPKRSTPTPVTQPNAPKDSSNLHTPLAVRHLSASKQEEYRRLKRQILEREKLKQQSKAANTNNGNSAGGVKAGVMTSAPVRQNQTEPREPEKGHHQQSSTEVQVKSADVVKNPAVLNACRASTSKVVSANIAKQTNLVQAKTTRKPVPNLSIRITNEIAPAHVAVDGKTAESSVEPANRHQPMSDKQQFRPALRTLSRDEINRKYVQVQLKQDTTERVVIINEKASNSWHDTTKAGHSGDSVENNNVVVEKPDGRAADKVNENNGIDDNDFSNATTILNSNVSRQELEDSMETTWSRSQCEHEGETNRNVSTSSLPSAGDDNSDNANDASAKSGVAAGGTARTDDIWDALKRDVKTELESLARLPRTQQQQHLSDTQNKLVAKRYTVLDHLADMSGNLRQWDMEKDLLSSLAVEVKKLKEQLRIAEERLEKQRNRISNMGPKISTARQKINIGRRECFKLSRICTVLGNRLVGKNYKLPEAGGQLLSEKLKEVASHTRQLSKKKLSSNDASENSMLPTSLLLVSSSIALDAIEDISPQTPLTNDAVATNDAMSSRDDIPSCSERCNDEENSLTIETSGMLPSEVTPTRKNQVTSAIVPKFRSDEQDSPDQDQLLSEPKLSSTPISVERNNECTQRTRRVDTPVAATSPVPGPSTADPSLCPANEQRHKKRTESPVQPPMTAAIATTTMMTTTTTTTTATTTAMTTTKVTSSTMINTATTATTTTTTTMTTTIEPYESILTHFKTPRNADPNGILCPYDLMGICNDQDCKFVHQST